jgi:diguanylate cyclase (GGDEF)-like protein
VTAEIAQERAMTDALTGLLNRYGLQRVLAHEYAEARRYARSLSCLMIDLDNFKTINDTFGHATGDAALKQVGTILTDVVRRSDMVSRYGGDEFLVLLPETDLEGAEALAEKVLALAARQEFGDTRPRFQLTLSIGAATLSEEESGNDMIARADMALYEAKEQGRNRVERAELKSKDEGR